MKSKAAIIASSCMAFACAFYAGTCYERGRIAAAIQKTTRNNVVWRRHLLTAVRPIVVSTANNKVEVRNLIDNSVVGTLEDLGQDTKSDSQWLLEAGRHQGRDLTARISKETLFSGEIRASIVRTMTEKREYHMVGTYVLGGRRFAFYLHASLDSESSALALLRAYDMLVDSQVVKSDNDGIRNS